MVKLSYHRSALCDRPSLPRNNILEEWHRGRCTRKQRKAHLKVKPPMNTTLRDPKSGTDAGNSFRSGLAEYVRAQALPVDKLGHQPRLYALTRLIGQGLSYDDDVVYAAAWLHDLGVFIGHRPENPDELARWDNVAYAMKLAPSVLHQVGFPASKVVAVVD